MHNTWGKKRQIFALPEGTSYDLDDPETSMSMYSLQRNQKLTATVFGLAKNRLSDTMIVRKYTAMKYKVE